MSQTSKDAITQTGQRPAGISWKTVENPLPSEPVPQLGCTSVILIEISGEKCNQTRSLVPVVVVAFLGWTSSSPMTWQEQLWKSLRCCQCWMMALGSERMNLWRQRNCYWRIISGKCKMAGKRMFFPAELGSAPTAGSAGHGCALALCLAPRPLSSWVLSLC